MATRCRSFLCRLPFTRSPRTVNASNTPSRKGPARKSMSDESKSRSLHQVRGLLPGLLHCLEWQRHGGLGGIRRRHIHATPWNQPPRVRELPGLIVVVLVASNVPADGEAAVGGLDDGQRVPHGIKDVDETQCEILVFLERNDLQPAASAALQHSKLVRRERVHPPPVAVELRAGWHESCAVLVPVRFEVEVGAETV
ncbi:uncharacterized protein B0I36DRAFT_321654 [Microdochium trichocladiopsis]|uniref:Uncharacterized protein n=1 Tax=Microdochium trichocladiopsis TaxID=1682393 RepID=A0A9P8Y9F9_9PEZI|nr:uncharacterized protein B0I36DRAFT_321654 [Microdochium trichocladiopsis]KAH7033542.1 hypothetical protein B0I36DRAFT_321654 [Microdochium trichocladiopsis]